MKAKEAFIQKIYIPNIKILREADYSASHGPLAIKRQFEPKRVAPTSKIGQIFTIGMVMIVVFFMAACNSSSDKLEKAEDQVIEADQNLLEAQINYMDDISAFRTSGNTLIAANETAIANLYAERKQTKAEIDSLSNIQIAALEKKNKELKTALNDYKADSEENWQSFKSNFKEDMEEISTELSGFKGVN